ncbi:MAG: hypothetical protein K1X47_14870 [Cyclobacteriaceae bacterium]|mgnify:CR=1 FL=1|nr:hypothetical protein [Cyclobacteriaceae bacterium]
MKSRPGAIEVKQRESIDCGPACLTSIAAYYGWYGPLSTVRKWCSTDRTGTSIQGLISAAKRIGLEAQGIRCNSSSLTGIPLPAVAMLHGDGQLYHFVVIYSDGEECVEIMDPALGKIIPWPKGDFRDQWTRVLITAQPGSNFQKQGDRFQFPLRIMFGNEPRLWLLLLLAIAYQWTLAGLLFLAIAKINFEDGGLIHLPDWWLLAGCGLGIILIHTVMMAIFSGIITRLTFRMFSMQHASLLKKPAGFFEANAPEDIFSHVIICSRLGAVICDGLLNGVSSLVAIIISLGFIWTISWTMAGLLFTFLAAWFWWWRAIAAKGAEAEAEGKRYLSNYAVELNSVSTMVAKGTPPDKANEWMKRCRVLFNEIADSVALSNRSALYAKHVTDFMIGLLVVLAPLALANQSANGENDPWEYAACLVLMVIVTDAARRLTDFSGRWREMTEMMRWMDDRMEEHVSGK